jgi:hypothetical protein
MGSPLSTVPQNRALQCDLVGGDELTCLDGRVAWLARSIDNQQNE